jgi:V8-like Glu-specific endopeptidase
MKPHISQLLQYATVSLNITNKDLFSWTGTGFFVDAMDETNTKRIPLLITSKHILENGETLTFQLRTQDENGEPQQKDQFKVQISDLQKACIYHPSKDVDIAAVSIAFIMNNALKQGKKIFTAPFTLNLIPNETTEKSLFAMEEIVSIGYPDNLWDMANNLPLFRKGITSSNPTFNYNGKEEFLVDVSDLPGTSGSPVLIFSQTNLGLKDGKMQQGGRLILLGVLSGSIVDDIEDDSAPMDTKLTTVIKSRKIIDIFKLLTLPPKEEKIEN